MLLLNLITALYICAQDFSKWGEKTRMTPPPHYAQGGGRNYTCPSPMCTPMIMNHILSFEGLVLNYSRNMPSKDLEGGHCPKLPPTLIDIEIRPILQTRL